MARAFNIEGLVRLQNYMGGKTLSDAQFFAVLNADVVEMIDGAESTTKRRYFRIAENDESVTFSCILGSSQQQLVLTKSSKELDVETSEISEGGGRAWTGHADVEGLKAIGWDDEDIAYYQEHGVNWNEEDDQYHLVPDDNKALYGVINIDNIQDYKGILVYLPKIDTTGVTSMAGKFQNCFSLVSVPMMDTSSVTDMSSMFSNCFSLTTVPQFDTSNVSGMGNMFTTCCLLSTIPLFDTSSVTSMGSMFSSCYSLVNVPVFNTSKVTIFGGMFSGCRSLVNIPTIDILKARDVYRMFYGCYSTRYFTIKNMKLSVDISATSLLEKSSLLYIIENAAPTSSITITLSAYCYNKFSNDPDVVAALSAQPLVSLASA